MVAQSIALRPVIYIVTNPIDPGSVVAAAAWEAALDIEEIGRGIYVTGISGPYPVPQPIPHPPQ